jgi:acetyl esterase/lipase
MDAQGHCAARLACRLAVLLVCAAGCRKQSETLPAGASSVASQFPLASLRAQLKTTISAHTDRTPAPEPPAGTLDKVYYEAPLGKNVAYVSPVKEGTKRPAIVWLADGMDWGINSESWRPAPRSNDQSARAFRESGGIVLMRPSLRGSNENPGTNECFLGEVDDLLAAADYLAKRPDVNPKRIYLGGHSTGGTLVLLTVASSDRFRAAFAFGPVADARQYGSGGCLPADISDAEALPRAPIYFLKSVRTPTLVIEGVRGNANIFPLLKNAKENAPIDFALIPKANHYNTLAPASAALAAQIMADTEPMPRFKLGLGALAREIAGDEE